MKLLFFVDHFRLAGAGAENDAVCLCKELARRGHQVAVAANSADTFADIDTRFVLSDATTACNEIRPDVTVDWGLFRAADVHRIGGGIHESFIRYALDSYGGVSRWVRNVQHLMGRHQRVIARERDLLRRPGATFLAISRFIADHAMAAGAEPDAVRVLHNSVNSHLFVPGANTQREALRAQWGIAENDIVFLFIAHNLRLKNIELLRAVFDQLPKQGPSVKLVVVGKRRPEFNAPYLTYAGPCTDMPSLYCVADGLLHPSYFDSFGNVVIEAMSCGLPVVVSDRCGVAELIEHGVSGFVLPVVGSTCETRDRWSTTMMALANASDQRLAIGRRARVVAENHDFQPYVNRLEGELIMAMEKTRR